jgi:release factor glutamine methyltransferase
MLIKHIKDLYVSSLSTLYDEREAVSIFYICMEDICGFNRSRIATIDSIDELCAQKLIDALESLQRAEPVQYVTGKAYFYGRIFAVDKRVLIPRGETEEIVDWILTDYDVQKKSVLDIGVGSGAICVSLAAERKNWQVEGIDISTDALCVATGNAVAMGADINLFQCDVLDREKWNRLGRYDIIVSNPPYVLDSERRDMHSNVTKYEPHIALYVPDADPLLYYREIAQMALSHLNAGGALYFEINQAYGRETVDMLRDMGYGNVELKRDINGKDRMVKAVI